MPHVPLDQLTFAAFQALLNTRFRVSPGPAISVELELVEATATTDAGRRGSAASGYEYFSLVFSGPASQPLAQRMYSFEHEKVGTFDLFIVPIAAEQGRIRYQAVFNRPLPPPKP